jgi:hypothetical protein
MRQRSAMELVGVVAVNSLKLLAAGVAFVELLGQARPEVMGGAAFLLTVALSMESSINNWFEGRR